MIFHKPEDRQLAAGNPAIGRLRVFNRKTYAVEFDKFFIEKDCERRVPLQKHQKRCAELHVSRQNIYFGLGTCHDEIETQNNNKLYQHLEVYPMAVFQFFGVFLMFPKTENPSSRWKVLGPFGVWTSLPLWYDTLTFRCSCFFSR